jgi:predicted NBD/HSP70 family sugar kinase
MTDASTHTALPKRAKGRPRVDEVAAPSLVNVLNLVRTGQAATRQEIERASEFGRAVVTDRLATLSKLKLVDESELGATSGGRAPRLARFNQDAGHLLLATLDQTALGVAVADLTGTLSIEHHEALDLGAPVDATLSRLETLFDWLLEKDNRAHPVWGIGISVPSPVQSPETDSYPSISPPILPAWEDVPFVERLVARFGAPVWLRSSVETMTMGEAQAGEGTEADTMLLVKVGKRISAGLVVDGRLYRGTQGAAGLIGQLPVTANERTGPLEVLAGSDTIARDGQEAGESGRSPYLADILRRAGEITAIDVGQAAQAGDTAAMEIMSRSGRLIGHTVATLANMLNPSLIVLSGSIAQTNDILLAAVREVVYGESHPLVTRDLRISASRLGSSAGLVGAAAVVVDALFDPARLRSWVMRGSPIATPEFETLLTSARATLTRTDLPDETAPAPPAAE